MISTSTAKGFGGKMTEDEKRLKNANLRLMQDIEQIDLHVTGMENDRTNEEEYGNG
jgi:hypothetical protein